MSENSACYAVTGKNDLSKAVLRRRDSAKRYCHPSYRPPTQLEIESLISIAGWTQNDVADIVGVNTSEKGSSTIRRWKCDPESSSYRAIPYSAWRLLLIESGIVRPS